MSIDRHTSNQSHEVRLYSPTGILGYGCGEESLERALATGIEALVIDAGSIDPGPYYLGSGTSFTTRNLVKRDLRLLLKAVKKHAIPLLIGSAGGAGGTPHVRWTHDIVQEVAQELGCVFRVAVIESEQSKERLVELLREERISPIWPVAPLDEATLRRAARVVGVMGVEPMMEALANGAEVVVAGRADDAAMAAAVVMSHGLPAAQGWLAGRFLECGAACAIPRHGFGFEGLLATVREAEVVLEPMHDDLRCTTQSVAAFLLHENQSPFTFREPSGTLDLTGLRMDELDARRVRLRGAEFDDDSQGSVKLEGAELAGYRSITPSWTRDPILIGQIHEYLERARQRIDAEVLASELAAPGEYDLTFRLIGHNAVMAEREPATEISATELGILVDVVAPSQEAARGIATSARQLIKNAQFTGKLCDEGCITFPYSPSELDAGPVYRFSIWHAVSPADVRGMFAISYGDVGRPVPVATARPA